MKKTLKKLFKSILITTVTLLSGFGITSISFNHSKWNEIVSCDWCNYFSICRRCILLHWWKAIEKKKERNGISKKALTESRRII